MSKRIFRAANYTALNQPSGSTMTDNTYQALKGGSTIQQILISDVIVIGLSTLAYVAATNLARATTLETSAGTLLYPNSDGWEDPLASALSAPPVAFTAATASPIRSTLVTDPKLDCSINAFGGIFRMELPPGKEWKTFGNSSIGGETAGGVHLGKLARGRHDDIDLRAVLT